MQKHQTLLIHDSQITGVSLMESFTFFLNSREVEKKASWLLLSYNSRNRNNAK